MSAEAPFRILSVCTGNVCRSPLVERLLKSGLDEAAPGQFAVSSAGTRAMVGDPAQPSSAEIAARLGASLEGFHARQLTADLIAGSDLVLVLAESHRAAVVALSPAARERTFTLREFARILELLPGPSSRETSREAWRRLVADGDQARDRARVDDPALNDVSDPYGLGPAAYEHMAGELVPSVSVLIAAAAPRKRGRRMADAGGRAARRLAERATERRQHGDWHHGNWHHGDGQHGDGQHGEWLEPGGPLEPAERLPR